MNTCTVLIHEPTRRSYEFPGMVLAENPIRGHMPLQDDTLTPQLNQALPQSLLEGFHYLSRHTFHNNVSLVDVVENRLVLRLRSNVPRFKTNDLWDDIEDDMETHLDIVMEYPKE